MLTICVLVSSYGFLQAAVQQREISQRNIKLKEGYKCCLENKEDGNICNRLSK